MAAAVAIFAGILKPEATQTKKCSLIYIPKIRDNTNDFWTSVISGCKMAAEEYESDLEILAPDKEENIEEQNKTSEKRPLSRNRMRFCFLLPAWMHQMNF